MSPNWELLLLPGILVSLAILILIVVWQFYWRFHFIWRDPEQPRLKAYICKSCDGWGDQWWDPDYGKWMPIPMNMRTHATEHGHFRVDQKMANSRRCEKCLGIGHHWANPL